MIILDSGSEAHGKGDSRNPSFGREIDSTNSGIPRIPAQAVADAVQLRGHACRLFEALPLSRAQHDLTKADIFKYVGGCQNYGPLLGPYILGAVLYSGLKKGPSF